MSATSLRDQFSVPVRFSVEKLIVALELIRPYANSQGTMVRDRFGLLQIENQRPKKALRVFTLR